MESLTPSYDSSSSESVVSFYTPSVTDDVTMINRLLLLLIKTVDVDELLTVFYQHTRQLLPIDYVSLICEDRCLSRGFTARKKSFAVEHSIDESHTALDASTKTLRYGFAQRLSMSQHQLLTTLHQALSHQLYHALSFSKLTQLATKDTLTSLGNRAAFDEDCELSRQSCFRRGTQLGLLVIDLDNFKTVNDTFGHKEGDNVLMTFANTLTSALRSNEKAYRFGGDEFCCLLDVSCEKTMQLVADRIMQKVANSDLLQRHGISVSIGGTHLNGDESIADMFKRADKALYLVKQQGKHGFRRLP